MKTFGRNLAELRTAAGLTQEKLAEAADISMMSVSRYERGIKWPKPEMVSKLAKALGVREERFWFLPELVDPKTAVMVLSGFVDKHSK